MSPIFQSQSPQSRSIITLTNNPTDIKIIPCDSTHSQLSNEYMQDPTNPNFFLTQLSQLSPIISPTINPIDLKIIPRDSTHSQLSNEYMQYPTSQNFIFRYFSPNESKPRTYKSPRPRVQRPPSGTTPAAGQLAWGNASGRNAVKQAIGCTSIHTKTVIL